MSANSIRSGEEIVKEFFEKVKKDSSLDKNTREAIFELFKKGNLKKASIKKELDSIRSAALGEEDDETKQDQG